MLLIIFNINDIANKVRSAALTGLSLVTGTAITAADTVLSAFGKLQKQVTNLVASGTANRIPYWSNPTTLTSDAAMTRDPSTKFTEVSATVNGAGKTSGVTITDDFLALGIKGTQVWYRLTADGLNGIFGCKVGDDTAVSGEEIATLFYTDITGGQDNAIEVRNDEVVMYANNAVVQSTLSLTAAGGFLFTGSGNTSASFCAKFTNLAGTTLLSFRNDGLVSTSVGQVATLIGTETFTNKRITARTGTVASSATPTINTDNIDFYSITALAAAITSFTTNLSGTPTEGQTLWIAITDNGTARAIAWGASFESSTITLPTTTVISTRLDVAFIWNSVSSRWRCVGTA